MARCICLRTMPITSPTLQVWRVIKEMMNKCFSANTVFIRATLPSIDWAKQMLQPTRFDEYERSEKTGSLSSRLMHRSERYGNSASATASFIYPHTVYSTYTNIRFTFLCPWSRFMMPNWALYLQMYLCKCGRMCNYCKTKKTANSKWCVLCSVTCNWLPRQQCDFMSDF